MPSILLSEFLKHYRKPIPQISTNLKPITCQKGGLNGSLKSYPGFLQRMKAALHLYQCTQALVTFQYICSRGLCNISPLSSDGNIFDTEISIHFLWTRYLLIPMLNSELSLLLFFYLLSAWLFSRKHNFFQTFLSSGFLLYKLSSVYHIFAQHRIISRRYSRLFQFHNERSGT